MGGKKTKTEQVQSQNFNNQNQYDFKTAPDTQDTQALRDWRPQVDPGLGAQYANARNQLNASFVNPLGGYATAGMQDAQKRTGLRQLNQDEAQAFRGGMADVNAQRGGQLTGLAALTRPTLVNTGSSGTGNMTGTSTQTQSGGLLGDVIGAGSQVASAALL